MTHDTMKARLIARRAELTHQMEIIERDLDKPAPKDSEDAASERQGDEVLESLGAHDATEVRAIDAALARMDNGTYGLCAKCGEDIAPARLEAVPTTPLCRNCAG
jgi:RNA polymerase-binding transcription factor DksA